jgi:hypothetical protein
MKMPVLTLQPDDNPEAPARTVVRSEQSISYLKKGYNKHLPIPDPEIGVIFPGLIHWAT